MTSREPTMCLDASPSREKVKVGAEATPPPRLSGGVRLLETCLGRRLDS
jgi:hypothetical protein